MLRELFIKAPLLGLHRSRRVFLGHAQRFLLCTNIVSISEDYFTNAEMIATFECFKSDKAGTCLYVKDLDATAHEEEDASAGSEPPLTVFVRNARENLIHSSKALIERFKCEFPHSEIEIYGNNAAEPSVKQNHSYAKSTVVQCQSSVQDPKLHEIQLNLQPDGKGFVDDRWENILSDLGIKMWRRPLEKNSGKFEYRVCGSFADISAESFLEVQLNLDLRRTWDANVVSLEPVIERSPDSKSELVRWVTKFPFPMSNREYTYARRWLVSHPDNPCLSPVARPEKAAPAKSPEQTKPVALIANRAARLSESDLAQLMKPSSRDRGAVKVHDYVSYMVVYPHSQMGQPGLDFYLVYYDDPRVDIPGKTASWLTKNAVPRFMEQVHHVASKIQSDGLPQGVMPVLMPPGLSPEDLSAYRDEEFEQDISDAFYGTSLYPSWMPRNRREAVHVIFT